MLSATSVKSWASSDPTEGHPIATRAGHNINTPIKEVVEELTPLDAAILALLPEDGSKLGYHWLAPQTPTLVERLNANVPVEHRVVPEQVGGRLQTMEKLGLVVRRVVQPTQKGKGVQITERGQGALLLLSE